jgi:two-component system chemotaxis sensor kinase CheA
LGEVLVASGDASPGAVRHALRKQRAGAEAQGSTGAITVRESVKVDALRLDQLVDMIGELVIAETMVTQSPEVLRLASPTLRRRVRQLEKISRDLQTMATSLRMVPVRATFQKMARLVRDVARKTGKAVEFHLSGEETELDKSVVDKISDPLVHLLRNAVDHGIEERAELRSAAGKAPVGNIHLRAYHKGGSIQIEIEDDGRGLNRGAIVRKAIEQGLITPEEHLSDREVWNLIFEPGFSTAGKLTELSGRGVGMDVVRRNIMALRGEIDIHSEAGRGCRFTISLPLTLAIIDGMVIRVGEERFIVPTLSIVISVRPRAEDLHTVARRGEMVSVRGQLLTLYRLGRVLNIPDAIDEPTKGTVMVVEHEGRQVGLLIDQILGQQQIVIKPLGEYLRGAPGLSGGAIMPDGNVGLVLDIAGLVELAGRLAPAPAGNEVTAWAMAHATGDKAYE